MSTRGFVGYKYKDQIQGWYNRSDSYPSYLGVQLLEIIQDINQDTLKDFFLNRVSIINSEENTSDDCWSILQKDWKKDSATINSAGDFYKDGLFCEYSYIFDLNSPKKKLLLFSGFGKKPSKGYEDWFYKNLHDKDIYYENYKGFISDEPFIIARTKMYIKLHGPNKEDTKILRTILKSPKDRLPTLIGQSKDGDELITELLK